MKAKDAELADSKLERIHSNKFIVRSWDIETKKGGTYTITTDYAIAAPASTLLKTGYSVNGKLEEFTFPGTGDWTKFTNYSPGATTLPPEKCTLTVKGITSGAETKSTLLVPET